MASSAVPPPHPPPPAVDPLTETIKRRLIRKGVHPTPKIIHTLRKKHLQKSVRKSKNNQSEPILTESENESVADEFYFRTICKEYRDFTRKFDSKSETLDGKSRVRMIGRPWERVERGELRGLGSGSGEFAGGNLRYEYLKELGEVFEERRGEAMWVLEDDVEVEEGMLERENGSFIGMRRRRGDGEAIRFLVERLAASGITKMDWKFRRLMKQSGLQLTEGQLLKIVGGLGDRGCWRQAMDVVDWIYSSKEHRYYKSRFVYTKLLAVLGKARRPQEALLIFKLMRGDCHIYPDMAAYHSIAVTLGQAGLLRELINIIESMKQKPLKTTKNIPRKNWNPILQPDIIIFNAVLNACVPTRQWKGVSWVFQQIRKNSLQPNSATYGLAMEVMLHSGKYDMVHELFGKMKRSGEAPKALTYKVLVSTFWKEHKVDEAIHAVRDMERRGIIGTASVYYELACCLCNKGRWEDALFEINKLKKLQESKPLEVAFTGMIMSSMEGGHVDDCIHIFEHMKDYCDPNIGTINAMLKLCAQNDMFSEARDLFEKIRRPGSGYEPDGENYTNTLIPDEYTYGLMLEVSGRAHRWEYFENVYRELNLSGCQVDQDKHAHLFVEASRAGKWHLLEHAFDTILEAGEIPNPVIFTEMLIEAIIQDNYQRASAIINAMAHAPFLVSENDWTHLFDRNRDRICDENLKKLLGVLSTDILTDESTVSNLRRALHNRFKVASSKEDATVDTCFIAEIRQHNDDDNDDGSVNRVCVDTMFGDESDDCCDEDLLDDIMKLHIEDSCLGSDMPSADEILEAWNESGRKDGLVPRS